MRRPKSAVSTCHPGTAVFFYTKTRLLKTGEKTAASGGFSRGPVAWRVAGPLFSSPHNTDMCVLSQPGMR